MTSSQCLFVTISDKMCCLNIVKNVISKLIVKLYYYITDLRVIHKWKQPFRGTRSHSVKESILVKVMVFVESLF